MEYIEKHSKEAEEIIFFFLKQLKEENHPYPKDMYDIFKSAKDEDENYLKEHLINILLVEQNNRCCYCMRKLDESEIKTLEHVIPNKGIDEDKFVDYINPDTPLTVQNVCFAPTFIKNEESDFPPYPHTVSYHNLVISCDGKYLRGSPSSHCNLCRGNKHIPSLIFNSSIFHEIKYKSDGFVIWLNETNKIPYINELKLNEANLKMIRHIWFFSYNRKINPLELDDNGRNNLLNAIMPEVKDEDFEILFNFKNEFFWKKLKKYDYFYKNYTEEIAARLVGLSHKELQSLYNLVKAQLTSN